MIEMNFLLGDSVWLVQDYKKYARFSQGQIIDINENEIHLATFEKGKSTGTQIVYKEQRNIFISKDKNRAWINFIAMNYRGKKLNNLSDKLKEDIKLSQIQYPELWV